LHINIHIGSMTIPRDVTVSFAVFETEDELLKGAFKLYPKLKSFWETRKDKVGKFMYSASRKTILGIFEHGHCLEAPFITNLYIFIDVYICI
jgi:hypothetical protein